MNIKKVSARSYSSVTAESVARYIKEHNRTVNEIITQTSIEELARKNKTSLNAIAAELETIKKRLEYLMYGRY